MNKSVVKEIVRWKVMEKQSKLFFSGREIFHDISEKCILQVYFGVESKLELMQLRGDIREF